MSYVAYQGRCPTCGHDHSQDNLPDLLAAHSAEPKGLTDSYCDIHCKKMCQNSIHGFCEGPPVQPKPITDAAPCCTAFVEVGKPIPEPRCEHTVDLFGEPRC